jgi:glutamine amidotransferase
MCRWIAYRGETIALEHYVTAPAHSLIEQSMRALESIAATNGDGFGLGWYGEHEEPGLYREVRPAWSDENLRHLCRHLRSHLFFAHVRASTGTASTRANCHPFAQGRHLFMHNGQIGGYARIKRRIEAMVPDDLYCARVGTTDSEAMFLAACAQGLDEDPVGAMARTLRAVRDVMAAADVNEPLRFTAALTNGADLYAFRWACDGCPPSLYVRKAEGGLTVVSEPIDGRKEGWREVPKGCALIAKAGRPVVVQCLNEAMTQVAA